jgi:hypothetical protein
MRRREFITLLGGAAGWPLAARAQQPVTPRIGYIWIGTRGTDVSNAGLRQGLDDRGYAVGRNLVLEERYADGHAERLPALIAELLAVKVDVLVTPGTPITRAAQLATSTVPIVTVSGDPVGAGLVASLAHPGGNITGLSLLSREYSAEACQRLPCFRKDSTSRFSRKTAALRDFGPHRVKGGGVEDARAGSACPPILFVNADITSAASAPSELSVPSAATKPVL